MRFAPRIISPVLLPLYVCVSTNFVMELVKRADCFKVQTLPLWGALLGVISYISHLNMFCNTTLKINIFHTEAFASTFSNCTIKAFNANSLLVCDMLHNSPHDQRGEQPRAYDDSCVS